MQIRIKRQFIHYKHWEDWKDGLYSGGARIEDRCARLLSSKTMLYQAMSDAVMSYKNAALLNLSHRARNRRAWVGQASCCFVLGAGEDQTKDAWRMLSLAEQEYANSVADAVIDEWEWRNVKKESE